MLKDVKRKYPQLDLEAAYEKLQERTSYCPDMLKLELTLGGDNSGRSIVKSALALAVDSGVNPKSCEHARSYLLNGNSEACFGYYYESDLLINRPEGIPLHCVSVKGLPNTRQLIGYVEYFGVYRMVVCLSSSYEGQEFSSTYAINPVSGEELKTSVDLIFSNDDIQDIYDYKKIPDGAMKNAFHKVIPARMSTSFEEEKKRVINYAVLYAFSNCGVKEGETLMLEDIEKVLSLIMEKLEPFLLHNINYIKKP